MADDIDIPEASKLLNELKAKMDQLTLDCFILSLRLMGEDESTLSPEVAEVMARWKPLLDELLLNPKTLKGE